MKRLGVICALLALGACGNGAGERAAGPEAQEHALAPASLPAFFDCLRERGQTVVAAHRGGPGPGYAENAIATFAHTLSEAPALVEVDVSKSKDGVLILMHDDTLERTTTGQGAVDEINLAQLQSLALKDESGRVLDAHPPTLGEALEWARGRTILELDIKRGVAYEDVVAAIREADAADRVVFITYSAAAASRVHRLAPELMISTTIDSEADLQALERADVDLSRVLAWTGTEEPNSALNEMLAQRGVEAMFGTLGGRDSWDARFAREGADQYAAFAESGLQLISTDRVDAAARDLDGADGVEGFGAMQCAR